MVCSPIKFVFLLLGHKPDGILSSSADAPTTRHQRPELLRVQSG
jgi:hypothetical protein